MSSASEAPLPGDIHLHLILSLSLLHQEAIKLVPAFAGRYHSSQRSIFIISHHV